MQYNFFRCIQRLNHTCQKPTRTRFRLHRLVLVFFLITGYGVFAGSPALGRGGGPATGAGIADPGGRRTGNADHALNGSGIAIKETDAWREAPPRSEPIARELANNVGQNRVGINVAWTLLAAFLVMFMQAGFALLECGLCRAKNAAHVFLTNIMVYPVSVLGFWAVGFALMFGGMTSTPSSLGSMDALLTPNQYHPFAGTRGFFLGADFYDVGVFTMFLFQAVFMATMTIIPTGAMAERWRFSAFLAYALYASIIIYPIYGHWVWGTGWLANLGISHGLGHGAIDFAGSGVVHAIGGWTALTGAILLGPRKDRFDLRIPEETRERMFRPHNLPMAMLGAFILAFGWFGFNAGSTLGASGDANLRIGVIASNTMLASAAGAVSALAFVWLFQRKRLMGSSIAQGFPDPMTAVNGMLGGFVAITASCAYVPSLAAVFIGLLAGCLVPLATILLVRLRIDDPVGAFPVHGVCGIWGLLSVGVFADGTFGVKANGLSADYAGRGIAQGVSGLVLGDTGQFIAQLISCVAGIGWAVATSALCFGILKRMGQLRSHPEHELVGLDHYELGVTAYSEIEQPVYDLPPASSTTAQATLPESVGQHESGT